jgi:ribosomal protein S18 acetylase RimI-like enzyme
MKPIEIIPAISPAQIAIIHDLFVEYSDSIPTDLCFQGFQEELAGLPGKYAGPSGRLLLAVSEGKPAGCVALRPVEPGIGEMKRLYVRPEFRGQRLGRRLAEEIITAARVVGYERLRLDTLASMKEANGLYTALGFRHIPAYCHNPEPEAVYFELTLSK